MGYESNFEVPDIDDTLLRGVDDLTDLLCPDSHPEDYASRGYQGYQGTCVFFWFFSLSPSEVFFPERRRKIVACTRGFPVSFPPETRSGRAKIVLVFLFARREFVREVRRARAVKKDARALSVKGIGRGRVFFFFSQILRETTHGQKTDLVFFSARRARNQQKPIYSNRTSFKRSTSRSTYTARHLHRFRLDYRQRRNARDNPRGRLDRRENKFG